MEPRFGHEFSAVRVHADAQAAESARAVKAHAYTVGREVVFADGQYAPHTETGRRLLAHELVHVAQQAKVPLPGEIDTIRLSRESDPQEREAEKISRQVADLRSVELAPAANTIVRIDNRPPQRKAGQEDMLSGLTSIPGADLVAGAHQVLWRREAVMEPNPIEENPAVRTVNDESPGLTSPAINGLTILNGQHLVEALPEPQYMARPAAGGGGFECHVAAPINVFSGTDMIVTTPPTAEGWRAEVTPGWLADNGETLCLIRTGSVPLLLRHDTDNRTFYNVVRRSEGEHHADVAELHRTILKPYHDRVNTAATRPRRGANAQACARAIAQDIGWAGTLRRYANAWVAAQQRRDGPGGTHITPATLTSSDYCLDATMTVSGA
jgi:hypothetical protein